MKELLFKEEAFQLVGFCMEIHRELGKGHDEVIYKDALVVELSQAELNQTSAQIEEAGARYDYHIQRAALDFQLGRLH